MTPPVDFSSLSAVEKDALIAQLLARLEALERENAELRAKLKLPPKTPDNSSTPPSRGHKASDTAGAGEPRKAKGTPHAGAHRALHPNPDRRLDLRTDACPHCQADVSGVAQDAQQAYDRIELPAIKPDVTRVTLYGGVCPCCAQTFKAAPPAELAPGSPFGPNLRAFVLYLRFTQAISFERLSRLCSDLLGLAISEGALVNMLENSREHFARQASLIRDRLLAGTILASDETSVRVGKQTWWTWVFHHAENACFVIHRNRSRAVVEEFLGTYRPDYWVSDRLAAQMAWARKDHQVCLAHLLRDVQYAIDAGDAAFAPRLHALLKEACAIARRRDTLADTTLKSYAYKLDAKLDALIKITPQGQEGAKLQRMVRKYRRHFFVFLDNRAIPPTNNGSEQAIRPCVVFRKVTNCFRSQWGAKLYADIRSVLETACRRTLGSLHAIRLTLNGQSLPETG